MAVTSTACRDVTHRISRIGDEAIVGDVQRQTRLDQLDRLVRQIAGRIRNAFVPSLRPPPPQLPRIPSMISQFPPAPSAGIASGTTCANAACSTSNIRYAMIRAPRTRPAQRHHHTRGTKVARMVRQYSLRPQAEGSWVTERSRSTRPSNPIGLLRMFANIDVVGISGSDTATSCRPPAFTASPTAIPRQSSRRHVNDLRFQVVLKTKRAPFASIAGLLIAAERRFERLIGAVEAYHTGT